MRVIHVINGLETGGAETVLYRLATYPSDVQHQVISLEDRGTFSDRLESHGVVVHHLNWKSPLSSMSGFIRLYRLLRRSDPDVVQAWMYRANLLAGLAGKVAGLPVVWNIRSSTLAPLRLPTRILARLGGRFASLLSASVINCSSRSADLHARFGYDAAKGFVIANGYDPEVFAPDDNMRNFTRSEFGISPETFLVGTIARWHLQKGYPILVRALGMARSNGVPIRALLVGRGMDGRNGEIKKLIRECGLQDCVQLLGERAEIPSIARALDVHVLSSIGSEGFPNAVAETSLSGTPNIVTDVGDSKCIVGDSGWIIPTGDPKQLAVAIEQAYTEWSASPVRWQERRLRARKRIVEKFSLQGMVLAYEKVWRQVADR